MPPDLLPEHWRELPLTAVARLAPVQPLIWSAIRGCDIEVAIKREETLHPLLGGNKFYKLHGHLQAYGQSGAHCMASFGGAYSNHLIALAAAGQQLQIPTLGIVRGGAAPTLSPTLAEAQSMGMQLVFVSREDYKNRDDPAYVQKLLAPYGPVYCVPEGGGDLTGARGCRTWAEAALSMAPWEPTHVAVACGTGATGAGVLAALASWQRLHVFLALKGRAAELAIMQAKIVAQACALRGEGAAGLQEMSAVCLESNYSCGGYARFPSYLRRFVSEFEQDTGVTLDPVYTAKLFWGIAERANTGGWPSGTRLLVLHTGGLQGRRGFSMAGV